MKIHGLTKHPLFRKWIDMRRRCRAKKGKDHKNYVLRGIKVEKEWESFLNFYFWAIDNGYKKHLLLDRINNDGNYEPSNCRFVNRSLQNLNRRKPKLTNEMVIDIKKKLNLGLLQKEIAKHYMVSEATISLIKNGKARTILS